MSLLQNHSVLAQYPIRQSGQINTDIRSGFGHRTDTANNRFVSDASFSARVAIPDGYRPGYSWAPALKPGNLSSYGQTVVTISPAGAMAAGYPISGSSTIDFTPTATGGLIVSGSGSATIEFSATGSILSIASGSGSATISFTPAALIGALAGLSASATISCTPAALISAVGYLSGTSTNETEFSADALARAVWDATATSFNIVGTMGEKLNDAGSAGNPWAALLADNDDAGTFGEAIQEIIDAIAAVPTDTENADALLDRVAGVETNRTVREALRLVLAAVAGKLSGAGTTEIVIRDSNDAKDRITATVDSSGNRTAVTYDDT